MRRWIVVLSALTALPAGVSAQATPQQPRLVFTISGGMMAGGDMWSLPRQLVNAPANARDTLAIARRMRPGLVAALSATIFPRDKFGYTFEIGYFGAGSESRCSAIGPYAPDAENKNQQACARSQGAHRSTSIIGFQAGGTYRFLPNAPVTPFVRATAGLGVLAASYVQTDGVILGASACGGAACVLRLLEEPKRHGFTWVATLAAGTSVKMGPGYQFRFEVRDFITSLTVATDSGTPSASIPTPVAKTALRTRHIFTLTAGLEVVLERRYRRRY